MPRRTPQAKRAGQDSLNTHKPVVRVPRIGLWVGADEPFFVQVRIALERTARERGVELVFLDDGFDSSDLSREWRQVVADIAAAHFDLFVCNFLPLRSLEAVLETGLPVVHLGETRVQHPHLVSLEGLFQAGQAGGLFLAGQLRAGARVLVVGGGYPYAESGLARLEGVREGLRRRSDILLEHLATEWPPELARAKLELHLRGSSVPWDAIFALSDPLALLVRDVGRDANAVGERTLLLGINGDPLALAAITRGDLHATLDVDPEGIGSRAVALALQLARGEPLPARFDVAVRLVTRDNVSEFTTRRLVALAELPSRLVGVNLERERERQKRLELCLEIGARIAGHTQRATLLRDVPEEVRFAFGYDAVRFFSFLNDGRLRLDFPSRAAKPRLLDARDPLRVAVNEDRALFMPDSQGQTEFAADPELMEVRTRTVLPVHADGRVIGVLDLHAARAAAHSRLELSGLRWIADQFGAALHHTARLEGPPESPRALSRVPPAVQRTPARHTSLRTASGSVILAVDPDLREREAYRALFRQVARTYTLHTSADGAEALRALERETPCLLVLEPDLTPMDGYALLEWMRQQPRLSGVPVVIVGARALTLEDAARLEYERVTWLHKHLFTNEELLERFERALAGQRLQRRASGLVKRSLALLHLWSSRDVRRDELARALEVTPNHLSHVFKAELGLTPWAYLNRFRVQRAKFLLRSTHLSVAQIAQEVGFEDPSYFARVFQSLESRAPLAYRRQP